MTKQRVIKLNDEKFKPLFDFFNKELKGNMQSDSWFAGFCIWYIYRMMTEKEKCFDNKTASKFLLDTRGLSKEEGFIITMGKFTEFIKSRKRK